MKLVTLTLVTLSALAAAQGYFDVPSAGFRLIIRSSNSTLNGYVLSPSLIARMLNFVFSVLLLEPAIKVLPLRASALLAKHFRTHQVRTLPSTTTSAPVPIRVPVLPMPMVFFTGFFAPVEILLFRLQ
jgi:hypothetical protein